ncbi:hypothetical protein B0H34DRAFT_658390 [Crassisporium funariophilum]|nr:hypothetical protein B0H34DRAFT_658390 [Crassisporium funariophilum]
MQLRAILADRLGKESLISAGTGSGKTLPITINILHDKPSRNLVTLTISPLTQLQATQEQDFVLVYGIRTFAINDHTPCDNTWWTVCIVSP